MFQGTDQPSQLAFPLHGAKSGLVSKTPFNSPHVRVTQAVKQTPLTSKDLGVVFKDVKNKLKTNTKHKGYFIYELKVNCGLSILLLLLRLNN